MGSSIPQYLLFFAVVGAGVLLGRALGFMYERRLKAKAEATQTQLDDIIVHALGGPMVLLGVIVGVTAGREVLTPVEPLTTVLRASVEIPVIIALAWLAIRLTDGFIETYVTAYTDQTKSKLDDELVPIASRITNIAIVSIAAIVILDSFGYNVTALIASLGIGGVAVAFASRKTMADVFGGAHILSTKPFVVGDVIKVNDTAGTVKEVGLRSTRIRDFDGRTVMLPNAAIADAEVTNVTSEPTRRVKTSIGLAYETTPDDLERALTLVTQTVNAVDGVDAEQTGAWFWEYGDAAMRIRLEYHIEARDRWKAVKDSVNRGIQQAFAEADIELAVPTRTLQVEDGGS